MSSMPAVQDEEYIVAETTTVIGGTPVVARAYSNGKVDLCYGSFEGTPWEICSGSPAEARQLAIALLLHADEAAEAVTP